MGKKKMKIKGEKKSCKQHDVLVVASKVKAHIKSMDMNTSGDAIACLSERVYDLLDQAAARTKANGRKTLRAQDL